MKFMTLAPGIGIIPEAQRNQAYTKLPFAPGEGGIRPPASAKADGGGFEAFLAAVAAGADPKAYAQQLLESKTTGRKARRGLAA